MQVLKVLVLFAVLPIITAHPQEQQPQVPKPYEDANAYQIYSLLLPNEEASSFAKGTLVVQEQTVSSAFSRECVTREVARTFKDAIVDFQRVNQTEWLLQRQFVSDKPYELVNREMLTALFKEGGWNAFGKRYPGSGGYTVMSAVGFNKEKSLAIVYSGSSCGNLCGSWSLHLFSKRRGKWVAVPGVTCATVS